MNPLVFTIKVARVKIFKEICELLSTCHECSTDITRDVKCFKILEFLFSVRYYTMG